MPPNRCFQIYIGVDNTTVLPTNSSYGRNAIRIQTNAKFNSGLFILSLDHMPTGTTTWPAFWSFGPNWPGNGEIDILEGIYNMNYNAITTHTTNSCTFANATCSYQGIAWNGLTHEACSFAAPTGTFNTPFNNAGGGVFAMEWVHNSFIKIWNFVKPNIPADITNVRVTKCTANSPFLAFCHSEPEQLAISSGKLCVRLQLYSQPFSKPHGHF